jgi:exodeoxyribonuclease V alpha subunit
MSLRRFKYGSDCLLSCDVLIVDEASMLDMRLAYACVSALSENAQLVLVGDMDQLPSVGPGNTLRDMIESGKIPVAYLTEIYRQAALSTIVSNAHAINKGQTPKLPGPKEKNKDFAFVEANEPDDVPRRVLGIVAKSLPNMGFKPDDIQVLTPMQKGPGGAISLNENLQTVLNPQSPEKPEIKSGSRVFRLGDRVIQLRNNYDKGIYNGEIGEIASVDPEDHSLTVRSQGVVTRYDQGELDELSLAYCLTVHKAQGSEFPAVVVAIHTQHYALLQRNLIYTALTRAKQFAVLVGSRRAIDIAVRNDRQSTRHTRLKERLLS